jgi:hypothetical protein
LASADAASDSTSASAAAYGSEDADAADEDEGGGRTCASVVARGNDTSMARGAGKVRAGAAAIERNEVEAEVGTATASEAAPLLMVFDAADDEVSMMRVFAPDAGTLSRAEADAAEVAATP